MRLRRVTALFRGKSCQTGSVRRMKREPQNEPNPLTFFYKVGILKWQKAQCIVAVFLAN